MMTVASSTSQGTKSTKLRLPVRLKNSAPINPPSTLGIRSNHSQPLPRTPVNRFRVRQTAVGYAKTSATALVASAVTGGTTSISSGKVINPPPPAIALMPPPTTLARKNNKYVSIIHASILLLMLMRMLVSAVAGIVDAGLPGSSIPATDSTATHQDRHF